MISRRSSARMIISASRNAVLPVTVTMAIAQWNRSRTANGSSPSVEVVDATIRPGTRAGNQGGHRRRRPSDRPGPG